METNTKSPGIDVQSIEKFNAQLQGTLLQPGHPEYDEARSIYNGMIDKHPAMIAQCNDVMDVVTCVNFARKNNLLTAIKSGGHNGAGLSMCDGGLVIDLSPMKGIQIDEKTNIAQVETGCLIGDVDKATHQHGLALPSGIISTTGVGGITLGGGLGYLTRKYGLTIDNLLEAEIVLADGSIVKANKDEHQDLFWAIRGGGGNFGVVTSFVFQLQPANTVYAGPMFWPIEKAQEVMKFYRELMEKADNDLYGFFAFLVVPPGDPFPAHLHSKNVCGVVWNYTGPMEKAEEVFKPIRDFGPPILDFVGEIPFPALNSMFDPVYPAGMQWYWKADFFSELTDEAIKEFTAHGSQIPTMHSTMHLYPIDGAASDISNDETAWNYRHAKWAEVIVGVDPDPNNKDKIIEWCRNYWEAMHPHSAGGAYINFMMEEGQERIKATYGSNYEKLRDVKTTYDPNNFFRVNQNIEPK